ncbi:MAG: PAS domain-containing sensor histidine kinase, partial [Bacteroidota bacterium]|nr:PAS domain-containing sensor histidine kinase [Bacteroidota bacterium]
NTKQVKWSAGFYTILGYKSGEIQCSYNFFLDNLLYHRDKPAFLTALHNRNEDDMNNVDVRLLTKKSGYQWFKSTTKRLDNASEPKLTGSFFNIHQYKLLELTAAKNDLQYKETGTIAKTSGWEIDIASASLKTTDEAYNIYELNDRSQYTLGEITNFFEPDYRPLFNGAIENAIHSCKMFDLELLFRTAKNDVIWIKAKGVPIIDDYGKCIKIRGIFQNIDDIKKNGLGLQSSIDVLNDQNKRLQNFAYIVSHNLRSHTGNLQFMVNLHEESQSAEDRAEVFSHIKSISGSLNSTIEHLNEIVKIHTDINKERKSVDFEVIFKNVVSALQTNIDNTGAQIQYDFSQCPVINYIPAYLESILQNLMTNALKYRHTDRKPVINCRTIKNDRHIYLLFEDNGMGIDLDRHGDTIFGMYKTFHQNTDSKGLGLFITRNQVESLGGSIKIDSTVDIGTKFTVRLT